VITDFFESFKKQTKTETTSPLGGVVETWVDGATFLAGIAANNSREMQVAYRNGLAVQYTIVTESTVLVQDERVKRVADGKVFRITSNNTEFATPAIASVQYRQATAEVITP
jgi:head-tail adaptor